MSAEIPAWRRSLKKHRVRTPTLLQMEAVECGAAALGIILSHYGRFIPLEILRVECGVSRDGSKASNVVKVARRHGMQARGQRLDLEDVVAQKKPWIAFWNFNHFLVVEGFSASKVFLNDPATGPRAVTWEEFDKGFTGVQLEILPGESFEKCGQPSSIWPGLRSRAQGNGAALIFIVLAGLGLAVPELILPAFSRIFVDHVMLGHQSSWSGPLILGILLTACLQWGLAWLQYDKLLLLQTRLAIRDSAGMLQRMLRLPVLFFTQRYPGDLVVRFSISDRLAKILAGDLSVNLLNLAMAVFFLMVMVQYSLMLTLIAAGTAALNLVFIRILGRARTDESYRLRSETGKLYGVAMSGIAMVDSLKAGGGADSFFSRFTGYQAKAVSSSQRLGEASRILEITPALLATLNTTAILLIGGDMVINGELSAGELVAFQLLTTALLAPVNGLVNLNTMLQEVHGDLARVDDILHYPIEEPAPGPIPTGLREKLSGRVQIRDLAFGYSPLEDPLIDGFDLDLEPGSRVALVGRTGSGKSTITRLISGLYQPRSGEIRFDGHDRRRLPAALIQNSLSTVDQEAVIFAASIRDNLTLWNTTIPDAVVQKAVEDADLTTVVSERGGLDGWLLEDGANLSGGQRQRFEIARALCYEPSVIILDEATSALDTATEQRIDAAMRRRGCTCIVVAHRLSTIRDCDEIIVMDAGRIVQRGRHEQLIADADGPYAGLIHAT